jgi:predicted ATP-grasp superfamily ATP-dependent carboligase
VDALMAQVCARISELPDSAHILEMGVDVVLDDKERPHLIEINGRPRGRLASLARQEPKRFKPLHRAVVRRPFERILRLIVGGL